jgi:vitamin B12/bleomycin/antimicrobial peptide transport system ATP-binding/permease protein
MPDSPASPRRGLLRRFAALAGSFWTGPTLWQAWALTFTLLGLTGAEILLLIRFNTWLGELFDVLERRAVGELAMQCAVLAGLVAGTAVQSGLHLRVRRMLQLRWRRWLTGRLAASWLAQGSAGAGAAGRANTDGRIAEDIRVATEEAVELGGSLWQATLLLVCFGGILWQLSGSPTFQIWGQAVTVPGYMVWLAVLYAAVSAAIAALLGRPLVRATDARQAAEAEFRAALVHLGDLGPPEPQHGPPGHVQCRACTADHHLPHPGRAAGLSAGRGDAGRPDAVGPGLPATGGRTHLAGHQHGADRHLARLGRAGAGAGDIA